MYAGTKVNWHEMLLPESTAAANNDSLPLFLCAFSADKGSEEITDLVYSDFKKMYGSNVDFFKYGQPLLQAHQILAAGGRVLGKRIVAENATLSNLIIVANVSTVSEAKFNANNEQLYIDANGNETTTVTDTPATVNKAKIKYETYNLASAKTVDAVEEYAKTLKSDSKFPLFIVCDNGRGKSVKNVRIAPDYEASRKLSYMLYKICDYEGTSLVESQRFAIKPDATNTVNGITKSLVLDKRTCLQFKAQCCASGADAFIDKLAEITGYTVDELYGFDVLFGKTLKQSPMSAIIIDETGTNINYEYGIGLVSDANANGNFGDRPFAGEKASDAWATEAVKFFNGTFSDEIFDLDQHKIDFCVDANYPFDLNDPSKDVKGAIVDLANFREDFYYFRDLGLEINSVNDIEDIVSDRSWIQSPFVGDYESCYEIIDRYSHKQIKVTMLHGLAPLLVNHYMTNMAAPVAGEFNNFVITEAIEGSLNFIPRVSPTYDQKQILDDLRVNFANYTDEGYLVIQSTYTSQDHEGPLSYANNVIVTQRVIKAIRRYCPKIRFMLMEAGSTDFGKYKTLIEDNVINRFAQYFKSISLIYTADDEMTASKIFNASLYCYYRDFPQGEIFDVFAVEGSPLSNPV